VSWRDGYSAPTGSRRSWEPPGRQRKALKRPGSCADHLQRKWANSQPSKWEGGSEDLGASDLPSWPTSPALCPGDPWMRRSQVPALLVQFGVNGGPRLVHVAGLVEHLEHSPALTFLTGDIGKAVATALDAAGERDLEVLGADVAGQCLRRGLVDEIVVYVLPVLLGDGIRFSSPGGLARIELGPVSSTRSGAVTVLRFRVRK
jgi:hypothetical protein